MTHFIRVTGKAAVFVSLLISVTAVAHAEVFPKIVASPAGKPTITVEAPGSAGKSPAIGIAPGTPVTIKWTVPTGWKGCWSNWQNDVITASGSKTATLPPELKKGMFFVLTCFGIGQAQTVKATVSLIKPDLVIAKFTATATAVTKAAAVKEVKDASGTIITPAKPAIPANTYKTGTITFRATVKNAGKIAVPAAAGAEMSYQGFHFTPQARKTYKSITKVPDASWSEMKFVPLPSIAAGASADAPQYAHTAGANGPWYFRVKADSNGAVDEANEANNVKIIGPYTFITTP